jgi:hypothetical protein
VPKPTFASVTEQLCVCEYLQRAADDPDNPIVFDEQAGEYQFTYQGEGEGLSMLVIYHCPFCGGAAPESKRELLFEDIPREEAERIALILHSIHSLDDAIKSFGAPDFDGFTTIHEHEKDNAPPSLKCSRQIRYERLSTVADVWIVEHPNGKAWWQLQGKPIANR